MDFQLGSMPNKDRRRMLLAKAGGWLKPDMGMQGGRKPAEWRAQELVVLGNGEGRHKKHIAWRASIQLQSKSYSEGS